MRIGINGFDTTTPYSTTKSRGRVGWEWMKILWCEPNINLVLFDNICLTILFPPTTPSTRERGDIHVTKQIPSILAQQICQPIQFLHTRSPFIPIRIRMQYPNNFTLRNQLMFMLYSTTWRTICGDCIRWSDVSEVLRQTVGFRNRLISI